MQINKLVNQLVWRSTWSHLSLLNALFASGLFSASSITQLSISKALDIWSAMTSVLLCILLPPSHVLDNWEKCTLTPPKLLGDIEWPGAGLRHLCSLKPDNLIWRRRLSKLSHGSVVSQCPFHWPFSFFSLMVSVDGEGEKAWPTPTNKEVPAGNKWGFGHLRTECFSMRLLKETISLYICCAHNNSLSSHSAGMS